MCDPHAGREMRREYDIIDAIGRRGPGGRGMRGPLFRVLNGVELWCEAI
jgi:hypothetical protein